MHRIKYRVPFHSKAFAEYPYADFMEEAAPPLFFRFKKNYRSPLVNFNRFRCRGPEPAPDGEKKRLLLIGESYLFGVKLFSEEDIWSSKLQKMLDERWPGRWEVLNAGNPGYVSDQHLELWRQELKHTKPDILILAMGGNDMAVTSMNGPNWKPGATWPLKFIYALERKSTPLKRLLSHFCFYFLWRRMTQKATKSNFQPPKGEIPFAACQENIKQNFRALVNEAGAQGAKVICTFYAPAADFDLTPEDEPKAESIQANWRETLKTRTSKDLELMRVTQEEICPELGMPFINLHKVFQKEPRRFEMYYDLAHWNKRGMPVTARAFYREIDKLGWWEDATRSEDKPTKA